MGSLEGLLTIAADDFDFASSVGLIKVFEPVGLGSTFSFTEDWWDCRFWDECREQKTRDSRLETRDGARCVLSYVVGR